MKFTSRILTVFCAGVVGILIAGAASAQQLNQVLNQGERRIQLAQESQQRVDAVVNQTRSLAEQYRQILREIEGLQVYNTLLERQVARQDEQKITVRESIDQVTVIQRQIVPLMDRMISGSLSSAFSAISIISMPAAVMAGFKSGFNLDRTAGTPPA